MKITICGSIAFYDEMEKIKKKLESIGHEVKMPPSKVKNEKGEEIPVVEYYKIRKQAPDNESWVWDEKKSAILKHYKKIEWCDSILVLNYEKNNIKGYVGANTLMEMGLALYLNKQIYLFDIIPEMQYKEEILAMAPILINRDLDLIK